MYQISDSLGILPEIQNKKSVTKYRNVSKCKPVSLDTKLTKKIKANAQMTKEYGYKESMWLKNQDAFRKSCQIIKETVEIKAETNCWFLSSNQRLGLHMLCLNKIWLFSPIITPVLVTNLKTKIK